MTDLGPVGMAMQLLTESLFDALPESDHAGAVAYFRARQRSDGSFEAHPHANAGCLSTTSLCWAALEQLGPGGRGPAELARRYIQDQGGLKAVTRLFRTRGDTAALFLLSHGHVGPEFLPRLLPGVALAPLGLLLDGRVHAGNIMFILVLSALSEHHQPKRSGLLSHAKAALEKSRIRSYLLDWQNVDGGWNGSPLQTCLMLVGLHAIGATGDDAPIGRALAWLAGMKRRGAGLGGAGLGGAGLGGAGLGGAGLGWAAMTSTSARWRTTSGAPPWQRWRCTPRVPRESRRLWFAQPSTWYQPSAASPCEERISESPTPGA